MGNNKRQTCKNKNHRKGSSSHLEQLNINAAGIDIGAELHYAAVPPGRDPEGRDVRHFSTFTADLHKLADWLRQCNIDTVAMESTGAYWIPLFEILDSQGFDVRLVNPRNVKNAPGRKTDVLDCQWSNCIPMDCCRAHSVPTIRYASFEPISGSERC